MRLIGLEVSYDTEVLHLFSCISVYELELELIQFHMAQKPVLRGEVGCACVAREVSVERGGMGERGYDFASHQAPASTASAPQLRPHGQQGSSQQGRRALCSAPSHHFATGRFPPRVVARTSASSPRQASSTLCRCEQVHFV